MNETGCALELEVFGVKDLKWTVPKSKNEEPKGLSCTVRKIKSRRSKQLKVDGPKSSIHVTFHQEKKMNFLET